MKLLLVGPYPPPHGGVSVHVARAREELQCAGFACRVLNTNRRAPECPEYMRLRGASHLVAQVSRHALRGWTVHVHTSGHNPKSWWVAMISGIASRPGRRSILTIHSGMTPRYLASAPAQALLVARCACRAYARVVCVNSQIRDSLVRLGADPRHLDVLPAFLGPPASRAELPERVCAWAAARKPLLSTVLWFRPEYDFDGLLEATSRLRIRYPHLGLVVAGDGANRERIEYSLEERGLGDTVLLLGDVPHSLCLTLMACSDIFVRATLADGDSISVREALALGVPVVASDAATRPHGVVTFKAGDPDALADAICAALGGSRKPRAGIPRLAAGDRLAPLLKIYGQVSG